MLSPSIIIILLFLWGFFEFLFFRVLFFAEWCRTLSKEIFADAFFAKCYLPSAVLAKALPSVFWALLSVSDTWQSW